MDIIFIRDFRLSVTVGMYPWELTTPQTIELNLEINIPGPQAGKSDNIDDTIDYAKVVQRIQDELSQDRKSTRLNSSHSQQSRMPSSA